MGDFLIEPGNERTSGKLFVISSHGSSQSPRLKSGGFVRLHDLFHTVFICLRTVPTVNGIFNQVCSVFLWSLILAATRLSHCVCQAVGFKIVSKVQQFKLKAT